MVQCKNGGARINDKVAKLEQQLNDFDLSARRKALYELKQLTNTGLVTWPAERDVVNMHCHTFYSFNAFGYSPSALAWLAKRQGFRLVGIVDFDVLDAVDEFLQACEFLEVRGTAGIETRVFVPEFVDMEINSPGEPGIMYHMGVGFVSSQVPPEVATVLDSLRQRAGQRNLSVMERVNAYLDPVTIDYETDVLPLTPGGNPTERHMVAAYVRAAERLSPDPVRFWADRLEITVDQMADLMQKPAAFQNSIRSKLMKRGGVGYVPPSPQNFPTVGEFHRLIQACGALPCAAWLDGTPEGEQQIERLLNLLIDQGVFALNIVPDRNWNIVDPAIREQKVKNLYDVVRLANELALPLNVGTEMNAFGQKLVDDFDAPELAPVRQAFLDGAYCIYGHTVLQQALGHGYQSEWAQNYLPRRGDKKDFYTRVGYRVPPGKDSQRQIATLQIHDPKALLDELERLWG